MAFREDWDGNVFIWKELNGTFELWTGLRKPRRDGELSSNDTEWESHHFFNWKTSGENYVTGKKKHGLELQKKDTWRDTVGLEDVTILSEDIRHKWTLKYRCLLCCLLSLRWSQWAMKLLSGLFETVHRDQSQEPQSHGRDKENGFVAKKAKNMPSTGIL